MVCSVTTSRGACDANYFAFNGGHDNTPSAHVLNAHDDVKKLGFEFMVEYGGAINAVGPVADYNTAAGFAALSNTTYTPLGIVHCLENTGTIPLGISVYTKKRGYTRFACIYHN